MICTFLSRRAGASAMPGASPSFSGGAVRSRSTAVSIVFFLLVWVATGAAAQSPVVTAPPIPELTLPDALRIAVDGNPGLAELRERALTAAEVPSQAGTLPDPKLNFNALNLPVDTFSHSQEAMTQMQFGVSQSFPFPGTLHLRREAATYAAQAASLSVDEARLRLLRDVKKAWWVLAHLDRAMAIIRDNLTLIDQFIDIANTKYGVGKGLQQDVLLRQVERGRLHDRMLQLQGMRGVMAARLNALLARPQNALVKLPERIDDALPTLSIALRFKHRAAGGMSSR